MQEDRKNELVAKKIKNVFTGIWTTLEFLIK